MTTNKHRAIIDDDLINELVNHKIIKKHIDGRTEGLSLVANRAMKDYLKKCWRKNDFLW